MVQYFIRFRAIILPDLVAAALVAAAATPLLATGVGFYGGASLGRQFWEKKSGHEWSAGGGLVVDTAVARDKLFNYRFTLGCDQENGFQYIDKPVPYTFRLMTMNSGPTTLTMDQTRSLFYKSKQQIKPLSIKMSHAFGFGVLRTQIVRLWLGPELSVSGMIDKTFNVKRLWGIRGGLGLILGLNINPGDLVTLSFTASGRAEYAYRCSSYKKYSISYTTTTMTPPGTMPFPAIMPYGDEKSRPVSKKGLKDKGFRFGGQLNVAILFRVGDNYTMTEKAPAAE